MQIDKKVSKEKLYSANELQSGQVYECISDPHAGSASSYNGWVLLAKNYYELYGVWLNHDEGVFARGTYDADKFKFRKMQVKLVEL